MTNDRPPFPGQEAPGTGATQSQAQPYQAGAGGAGVPSPTQPASTQATPTQPAATQATPTQPAATQAQPDVTQVRPAPASYQASEAGATQARQTAQAASAAQQAPNAGWAQAQQAAPAAQAAPTQAAAPAQAAPAAHYATSVEPARGSGRSGSRRGGGVRSAVLGLVGGALGALGVVFALNQFGLLNTTVVTEAGTSGQPVSINTASEDMTVAEAVSTKVLPSVVSVHVTSESGSGLGSGVILDTDGNIITNNHVAGDATSITVTIEGKSYDAELVGTDASSDLAVVKANLEGAKVTPIEIGDSDALKVGDWVMTVGSPFGLDQSVSAGIVSSLARDTLMTSYSGNTLYANLIQVDAAINPGNSGGALVNAKGELVGISTLFSSDTESFAGIGFAIPGNYAVDVANKIIAGETVTHAYIGLSMQTVNSQNASRNNLAVNQGAYVAEVAEGGPAAEAGVKVGDIITAMNGQEIASADGMILAVRSHKIGETVRLTIMRGKEELELDVTLGSDEELQAQQQRLIDEQQTPQVDGLNGNTNGNGTTDSYGQRDILQELYEYLYNNRGGSYEVER